MSEEKLSLQSGIAYMDRCLDAELAAQRQIAHSAIDMDDWNKAQEILAASREAISRVEVLRGKFAEFKKCIDAENLPSSDNKAEEAKSAASEKAHVESAAKEESKAETPAAGSKPEVKAFSFADEVEGLIEKHSFAMAVCNAVPNMNSIFTYDEVSAKADMKKPVQLSNGMWAETAIPEDKGRLIIDALRKYCESRKQG